MSKITSILGIMAASGMLEEMIRAGILVKEAEDNQQKKPNEHDLAAMSKAEAKREKKRQKQHNVYQCKMVAVPVEKEK